MPICSNAIANARCRGIMSILNFGRLKSMLMRNLFAGVSATGKKSVLDLGKSGRANLLKKNVPSMTTKRNGAPLILSPMSNVRPRSLDTLPGATATVSTSTRRLGRGPRRTLNTGARSRSCRTHDAVRPGRWMYRSSNGSNVNRALTAGLRSASKSVTRFLCAMVERTILAISYRSAVPAIAGFPASGTGR